jgi:diphthamide biosynthesis methyltransferase
MTFRASSSGGLPPDEMFEGLGVWAMLHASLNAGRRMDQAGNSLFSMNPATVVLLQMEAEEEARLLQKEQESMSPSNDLEHDERIDWLRGSDWLRWSAHKPLHLIIANSRISPSKDEAVHFGIWNCME